MTVALRTATEADRSFFRAVYASTRADELAMVPWDDATKDAFVDHQFRAQSAHYATHYPSATVDVIMVDGAPGGRLYVDRTDDEIRVVDISLLPSFRGRGTGRALLEAVLAEARQTGRSVRISVERHNPARHLYDRLGFVVVEEGEVYDLMRWAEAVR